MPFGEYKGYGLSLFVDLFAGALIGAGGITHRHNVAVRIENNMVAVIVEPEAFGSRDAFDAEVEAILAFVTASKPVEGGAVLVPGDPERRRRAERLANGIPIEAETWRQIVEAGKSVGVAVEYDSAFRPQARRSIRIDRAFGDLAAKERGHLANRLRRLVPDRFRCDSADVGCREHIGAGGEPRLG
jgi:hypothetical protein